MMEELQDAIEDAHYINAMQNSVPKPTKEWPAPSPEQIDAFRAKLLKENPGALDIEQVCSGSLGFYLVSVCLQYKCYAVFNESHGETQYTKFLNEIGLVQVSNFIVDVAIFRV
jgi:hypothetical protein